MKNGRFESAKEMLQALIDGHKITCSEWLFDDYIYICENQIKNKSGGLCGLAVNNYDSYSFYQTTEQILEIVKQENEKLFKENHAMSEEINRLNDEALKLKSKFVEFKVTPEGAISPKDFSLKELDNRDDQIIKHNCLLCYFELRKVDQAWLKNTEIDKIIDINEKIPQELIKKLSDLSDKPYDWFFEVH